MPMFYFPLGNLLGVNYTFQESALTNRAANLSKNKIRFLIFQNLQNPVEMSGCHQQRHAQVSFTSQGIIYN